MNTTVDTFTRELRRLDPVMPGELKGALDTAEAAEMLDRILSLELEPAPPAPGPDDRLRRPGRWRGRAPVVLVVAPVAVAAAAVLVIFVGVPGGGGGGNDNHLAGALDRVAAVAGSRSSGAADVSYTYLKTREVSVNSTAADQRSWSVYQLTTREEWVASDGSGRLRVATGPSRFVGRGNRAEWEEAGSPSFLALGFGAHTEDRWLAGGLSGGAVEELPADPTALATRLRYEAEVDHGKLPVPAATLQLVAEDLRAPGASPALRQALYEAARRVPGIEYLGEEADPEGRAGIAVGVRSSYSGGPALYSLIFDPDTSSVLATETTSLARGSTGPEAPTLLRAMVYVESRGIESMAQLGGTSLSGFESPSACGGSSAPFLVYRMAARNPCPSTLDAALDSAGGVR